MNIRPPEPRPEAVRRIATAMTASVDAMARRVPELTSREVIAGIGLHLVSFCRELGSTDMPGDLEKFRSMCLQFIDVAHDVLSHAITDADRLDHLAEMFKACPHAYIECNQDENGETPWLLEISGCDPIKLRAASFRELIDLSIDALKKEPS